MKNMRVASIYSKALFRMGSQYLDSLEKVMVVWTNIPQFKAFIISPIPTHQEKLAIFELILGTELSGFFSLLIESGRAQDLPEIIGEYRRRVLEGAQMLEVELMTANPLDPAELEKIRTKIEKMYEKKVYIQEKIEPRIIGGVVLRIGNKIIDYSINGRLEKLRKELCK